MIRDTGMGWYAIMVQSGREVEIKNKLKTKCGKSILEMIVPEPEISQIVTIIRDEEADEKNRYKYFKGYIFLKTIMSNKVYGSILSIESIYKFLGTTYHSDNIHQNVPSKIPDKEIGTVKKYLKGKIKQINDLDFSINDVVEIKNGDLARVRGTIMEMSNGYAKIMPENLFKNKIKVQIENLTYAIAF